MKELQNVHIGQTRIVHHDLRLIRTNAGGSGCMCSTFDKFLCTADVYEGNIVTAELLCSFTPGDAVYPSYLMLWLIWEYVVLLFYYLCVMPPLLF